MGKWVEITFELEREFNFFPHTSASGNCLGKSVEKGRSGCSLAGRGSHDDSEFTSLWYGLDAVWVSVYPGYHCNTRTAIRVWNEGKVELVIYSWNIFFGYRLSDGYQRVNVRKDTDDRKD